MKKYEKIIRLQELDETMDAIDEAWANGEMSEEAYDFECYGVEISRSIVEREPEY